MPKYTNAQLREINQKVRAVASKKITAKPVVSVSGAIRHNEGKPRWSLLPYDALGAVTDILTEGAAEYGERNWEKGFPWASVYDSLMRHLTAWFLGENLDPKSGKPHLAHVACNVLFLLAFQLRETGTDDRPGRV